MLCVLPAMVGSGISSISWRQPYFRNRWDSFANYGTFGLAGLTVNMLGIIKIPPKEGLVSGIVIVITGVVTYMVLLYGSRIILHRQVTSELFLIIGWAMLEVASINRSFAWEMVTVNQVALFLVIVAAAAILSLYFYLQYYRVKPMVGYIYGMIPLITEAISMGIFEYLICVGSKLNV